MKYSFLWPCKNDKFGGHSWLCCTRSPMNKVVQIQVVQSRSCIQNRQWPLTAIWQAFYRTWWALTSKYIRLHYYLLRLYACWLMFAYNISSVHLKWSACKMTHLPLSLNSAAQACRRDKLSSATSKFTAEQVIDRRKMWKVKALPVTLEKIYFFQF